jgi:hypothetical protein
MMHGPGIVALFDWTFAPNIFSQTPQNIAVDVSIHDLSWWNKFIMYCVFSIKKSTFI